MSNEGLKARVGWLLARTQDIGGTPDPIPSTTGRISLVDLTAADPVPGLLPFEGVTVRAQVFVTDVRGLPETSMDYSSEIARVIAEVGKAIEGQTVKVSFLDGTPLVDCVIVRDPGAAEFPESPDVLDPD